MQLKLLKLLWIVLLLAAWCGGTIYYVQQSVKPITSKEDYLRGCHDGFIRAVEMFVDKRLLLAPTSFPSGTTVSNCVFIKVINPGAFLQFAAGSSNLVITGCTFGDTATINRAPLLDFEGKWAW